MATMIGACFDHFPDTHKHALVQPHIKKSSLDLLDIKSFRPISNVSFLSKLTERLVVSRFKQHAVRYHLLPPPSRQSTYGRCHSTETAVTAVHNDIVCAIDAGNVFVLMLLDFSAALTRSTTTTVSYSTY